MLSGYSLLKLGSTSTFMPNVRLKHYGVRCAGELNGTAPGHAPQQLQANGGTMQQPGLAAQLSPEGHSFMSPSDWDPTYRCALVAALDP